MDIIETIKEQIANNPVLLYMKGSPNAPQWLLRPRDPGGNGLWREVRLRRHPAEPRNSRQPAHLCQLADLPQLWVNGELVGGSDIILEMFEKGELQTLIKSAVGKTEA